MLAKAERTGHQSIRRDSGSASVETILPARPDFVQAYDWPPRVRSAKDELTAVGDTYSPSMRRLLKALADEDARTDRDPTDNGRDRRGIGGILAISRVNPKFRRPLVARSPGAPRDPRRDLTEYFDSLTSEYGAQVRDLVSAMSPMHPECQLSVCLPAKLSEESGFLYHALRCYAFQRRVEPELFEVVIIGNDPPEHLRQRRHAVEASLAAVEKAKRDFPHLAIHTGGMELAGSNLRRIGFLRSGLTDAVIARHMVRPSFTDGGNDHRLLRGDADVRRVRKTHVRGFLDQFAQNPHVDAIMGRLEWSRERFAGEPVLAITQVFDQLLDTYQRKATGDFFWHGPNLAVYASAFCRAGGYDLNCAMAEDVSIFHSLRKNREGSTTYIPVMKGNAWTRLASSTRRIAAVQEADGPTASGAQWNTSGFEFGIDNPQVRNRDELRSWELIAATEELRNDVKHRQWNLLWSSSGRSSLGTPRPHHSVAGVGYRLRSCRREPSPSDRNRTVRSSVQSVL